MAVNNNISNQQASITWLQLIMSLWFAISITFGFTTVYKDLQNDIDKTEQLKLEILDAREQSKRRIKNAEERILLKQEIEHLKIKNQLVFVDKVEKP